MSRARLKWANMSRNEMDKAKPSIFWEQFKVALKILFGIGLILVAHSFFGMFLAVIVCIVFFAYAFRKK